MTKVWRCANRLATFTALAGAVVLYFAVDPGRALALGLLLGSIVSILRFKLSYGTMRASLEADAQSTPPMLRIRPMLGIRVVNYGLSAGALAVAFLLPATFSPWTAVPGLFVMNAAILASELLWGDGSTGAAGQTAEDTR